MLIDIRYAIGDQVRYKQTATIVDKKACSFCNESGKVVSLFDGTSEECPRCEGKGYIEKEVLGNLEYEGTIQDIQVYYFGDHQDKEPYVLYRMAGWANSQTWIAESSILEKIK